MILVATSIFELSQIYNYVHINKTDKVIRASLNLKDLLEEEYDSITKQALSVGFLAETRSLVSNLILLGTSACP